MNNIKKLIVFNHDYQFNRKLIPIDSRSIQINVDTHYKLFESLNLFKICLKKYNLKKKIRKELENINELTLYGCQDYLSWYIYNVAKKKKFK